MIDINTYRSRIGLHSPNLRKNKFLKKSEYYRSFCENDDQSGKITLSIINCIFKIMLIFSLLHLPTIVNAAYLIGGSPSSGVQGLAWNCVPAIAGSGSLGGHGQYWSAGWSLVGSGVRGGSSVEYGRIREENYEINTEIIDYNFQARSVNGNIHRKKGILNMHLNIRSLKNKVLEVKQVIKHNNPSIIGISEAELKKESVDEKSLKIPGYDLLFPKSWSRHGFARVVMYVKSSLHYEQVHDLEDDLIQSVWIRGGFKGSKKIYFCHIYREHSSSLGSSMACQRDYLEKFLHQWEEAELHNSSTEPNEIHIAGDMNIDVLNGNWLKPTYHLVTLSRMVELACNLGNFSQLVSGPTRSQFNSISGITDISCIDHVYTNYKFRCSTPVVSSFGGSDHDLVGYTRYSKDPPEPAKTIRKRSYRNFVPEDFLADLRAVDWTEVYQCQDVDLSADIFTRKFRWVLNNHAPWITYQQRKHFVPWLTDQTKSLMDKRDALKAEAISLVIEGKDACEIWGNYRKLRNEINNRRKFEEINFKKEKINQNLGCPASTWQTAKGFMNWESKSGPPHQLSIRGSLVTKASQVANEMNTFFMDKVRVIRDSIMYLPNTLSKCYAIMENKQCKLSMQHVTILKVNKLLKKLKNSRSTSIDELDNYCVKLAADIIDKPLHHIITLSILQKKFPSSWKFSKVIPLHKKDSKLESKNYRPVAILSPLSKILEKIVYEQIYDYFSSNKIFNSNLHGYRRHRSTQTALLCMYDRWARAAAAGQVSGVVLLDLSAAFDLVEPELLIRKLRVYGVEEDYLSWIESYLTGRFQAVWIDHILSEFLHCPVGVPQGSNLGPLFFLIYFNDLPDNLTCEVDNYADDTTLTATAGSLSEIGENLTQNCETVSVWMRANKLKLNAGKTHILTMGTQERLRLLPSTLQVVMDDQVLVEDPAQCELLLGCHVQCNLKFNKQVTNLLAKLRTKLTGLVNLKYILPYPIRKIITEGIFNSTLVYCLPLFGGSDKVHVKDIQVLQNKAAQLVCHAPPRANRAAMYDKLDWLTVNQLIAYHTVISVFKVRSCGEPEYLAEKLQHDNRNGRIIVPNIDLTLALKSFSFRGAIQWNTLPSSIRSITNIGAFKRTLRIWIKENIPRFPD